MAMTGILAIQAGDNPRIVAQKLDSFGVPSARKGGKTAAAQRRSGRSAGRRRRRPDGPVQAARRGSVRHENAERWLLTYADMITLLMVLFVVMYAISNTDVRKFTVLAQSFAAAFNTDVFQGAEAITITDGPEPTSLDVPHSTPAPASSPATTARSRRRSATTRSPRDWPATSPSTGSPRASPSGSAPRSCSRAGGPAWMLRRSRLLDEDREDRRAAAQLAPDRGAHGRPPAHRTVLRGQLGAVHGAGAGRARRAAHARASPRTASPPPATPATGRSSPTPTTPRGRATGASTS